MEWQKRVCKDESGDIIADPAEFYYDIGKRLVLGKEEGMEVNRNTTRGIECLMRAAELGHAAAGWDLQCFKRHDDGLRLDFSLAAQLYQRHVDFGNCMAQSNLGVCYHKGRGVEKNLSQAVVLYKAAAEQGYPRALYNLAVCYDLGEGVEINVPYAVELYHRSAQGGYAVAQYYMGVCFLNGKGMKDKDPKRAIEMWTRAANQGHAFAQYSLAQAYRDGNGVDRDLLKAAQYFAAFTRWGDESGWEGLKTLLSRPLDAPYLAAATLAYHLKCKAAAAATPVGSPRLPRIHVPRSRPGIAGSAPSSPTLSHHGLGSLLTSMPAPAPVMPEAPTYRSFSERKTARFEENFKVPNLYDLCCLHFHKEWNSLLQNSTPESIAGDALSLGDHQQLSSRQQNFFTPAGAEGDESMIPAEVRHRIKYESSYCCSPKCQNFFFGDGRVQRTFFLRKDAGGSEAGHEDITLNFCSLACASFELSAGVSAGWKEFLPAAEAAAAST